MDHWLSAHFRINFTTGEETITYSHPPEEFVEEMRRRGERWCVAKRACAGCFYTAECVLSRATVKSMDMEAMHYHHTLECLRVTIARRLSMAIPGDAICYGYYYQHWHENQYLHAAKEAGLIDFYDVSHLPGPGETHLNVLPKLDVRP